MNILFITYFFPPRKAIASIRTYEVCKGLLAAGHTVHVATACAAGLTPGQLEMPPDWEQVQSNPSLTFSWIPSPWRSLHEGVAVRGARGLWAFAKAVVNRLCARFTTFIGFDPMLPWAWAAKRALAGTTGFDCVLVSAGPFSTLLPARALARRYRVPLILDYRDVWNGTPHTRFRLGTRWLERSILRQAALLVSISPSCLASIRGQVDVPGVVVTNGFGADVETACGDCDSPPSHDLVYAGAFYPPKRSCSPIVETLKKMRGRDNGKLPAISFVYAGPSARHVQASADLHGVSDSVRCLGALPRVEVLAMQARSLCTVVITSIEQTASLADRGIVTGKIFEAIALSRWVLVISPEDSDVRAMTAECPQVVHFHGGQTDEMAAWLASLSERAAPKGRVEAARPFAWSTLAAAFALAVTEGARGERCRGPEGVRA